MTKAIDCIPRQHIARTTGMNMRAERQGIAN